MDVRTFRASTMQEALDKIRKELGPEAAVLHSRQKPAGWLPWQRAEIEVTASTEVKVRRHFAGETVTVDAPLAAATANSNAVGDAFASNASTASTPAQPTSANDRISEERQQAADRAAEVAEQIQQAMHRQSEPTPSVPKQSRLEDLPATLPFPKPAADSETREFRLDLLEELQLAGVDPSLAQDWLQSLQAMGGFKHDDPAEVRRRLANIVAADIRTVRPIQTTPSRCTRVALVGPTGVGKTTTIAKLAAEFHLRKQIKVGLITVDTFRISAIEQLKTYAEIMDLPMEVASTAKEMSSALATFDALDLVLIDTAGYSPKDQVQYGRLRSLLSVAKCDEIHLVLSATSHARSLEQSLQQFTQLQYNRLILSKSDEVTSLGHLAGVLTDAVCPWSYVTSGQHVPDDIELADPHRLARQTIAVGN